MSNQSTTEGDAHGLSPEPAGSKPIDGDRPCPRCDGTGLEHDNDGMETYSFNCLKCKGAGVEPSVAPRPGSSLFSPPAPTNLLAGAGRAAAELGMLEAAVDLYKAASEAFLEHTTIARKIVMRDCREAVASAAISFVAKMRERPEGGLNTKVTHVRAAP